ncbi:hypothetical protein [Piscinibacter koreensis]|uniref:Uncharacterized protein n=1 Tax=Piscinibacter koreensis TaxID=2742824 RepID=A0A7Y6TW73_9BURK|nr:hypothetical protein [Schlegelella koreensis]NUZ05824.1 hypothetical protein [Schlegelella koreensis]
MTSDAPTGELVVISEEAARSVSPPAAAPEPEAARPRREISEAGWLGSSFDLLNGVEITENADNNGGDVFDTFFKEAPPPRRT